MANKKVRKTTPTLGPWKMKAIAVAQPYPDCWQVVGAAANVALPYARNGARCDVAQVDGEANARLIVAAPDLIFALKFQASWIMRDGTLCACPAGKDESEPRGKMPVLHSTSCEVLRAAIAKAEGR